MTHQHGRSATGAGRMILEEGSRRTLERSVIATLPRRGTLLVRLGLARTLVLARLA